jgi:hypothetical protein
MTMTYERDAWDELGGQGNGIIGAHLKCAKGHWLLDDNEAEPGMKVCIIMPTVMAGEVLWQDHKIVERNIGRIEDDFMPPRQITEGWSPYTSFQAVRADDGNLGELVTFTSSSWGGKFAFQKLANPYRLKQRRQFPICLLETKERGDINGNIDPVFRIVGWSDRANFAELLPPLPEAAIAYSPQKPALASIVNDEIPF